MIMILNMSINYRIKDKRDNYDPQTFYKKYTNNHLAKYVDDKSDAEDHLIRRGR